MLPSRLVVRLSHAAVEHAPAPSAPVGSCLQTLALLEAPGVVTSEDGQPLDVRSLSVRDFHVLRAFLIHARIVPDEEVDLPCTNCGKPFEVKPSTLFETSPFVDRDLDDLDLDAPFRHDDEHSIPRVAVGKVHTRAIRIAPRSVGEVLPLWHLETGLDMRLTPAIVTAMGITHLGRQRATRLIADALMRASPNAFRTIMELVYQAQYSPRLVGVHRCAECGARNDVEVLPVREIPYETSENHRRKYAPPDLETFEKMVREAGKRIYRQRGVRNIDLLVDDGVPACDDGGEPLLGCYTPGHADDLTGHERGPEIRLFYRTFVAVHKDEPDFDIRGEIDETIDHEVTHHLNFLSGDDPLDDEEHDVIAKEKVRRISKREATKRAGEELVTDIGGFFRTAWPVLVVAFVATWLGFFRCR